MGQFNLEQIVSKLCELKEYKYKWNQIVANLLLKLERLESVQKNETKPTIVMHSNQF